MNDILIKDNDIKYFYDNKGNKIYNDIIEKYNNNLIDNNQAIYLLKWCYEYFKKYYIDD